MIKFSTKAKILEALSDVVMTAHIPELMIIDSGDWKLNSTLTIQTVLKRFSDDLPLIVRSSSSSEDGAVHSEADKYLSVAGVRSESELSSAIDQVFGSYDHLGNQEHLFIQPMVREVVCS